MSCLDLADELVFSGLRDQIHGILQLLSPQMQIVLLFATMLEEISEIITARGREPVSILVKEQHRYTVKRIAQTYVPVDQESSKLDGLSRLIVNMGSYQAVIYYNGISKADQLAGALTQHGHNASAVHSNMTQAQRELALRRYRQKGHLRFLVLSDCVEPRRIPTYYGQVDTVSSESP